MSAQAESSAEQLRALEERFEAVVKKVEQLALENHTLRARHRELLVERARLLDQTQSARSRVEAMIERLKVMEREG